MADLHETHSDAPAAHAHDEHHPHVVPLWLLVAVFAALLVLTVVTVGARYIDIGDLNLALALGIALIKASLVVLYFMHLKWDSYFNSIALVAGLLFVALFIGITLADSAEYRPNIQAYQMTTPAPVPADWQPDAATPPAVQVVPAEAAPTVPK